MIIDIVYNMRSTAATSLFLRLLILLVLLIEHFVDITLLLLQLENQGGLPIT